MADPKTVDDRPQRLLTPDELAIANLVKTGKAQGLKFLGKKVENGKTRLQWLDPRVKA